MQYMIVIIFNIIKQSEHCSKTKVSKVAESEGKKPSLQHLSKTD